MTLPALKPLSVDAFIASIEADDTRVELWEGAMTGMVGGTAAAFRISRNVLTALHARLRDGPCEVFGDGMLVKIDDHTALAPDVSIDCSRPAASARCLTEPVVIIEVLSPTTEPADRGYRWARYRTLQSLEHYLLVAKDAARIEAFSREPDGAWRYRVVETGSLTLDPPGIELELGAVYEGVDRAGSPATAPQPAEN